MTAQTDNTPSPHPGLGFRQFVALIALMMAINALSIDIMLPALPAIGDDLGVTNHNQRQWVITAYLLGFGVAQLFYGPLADRYGRKPVLLTGLALYTAFTLVAAFAWSFETMMLARVLQGVGAAATRVLAISIVRDCYSGRRMARVMSLTLIVFLAAPIAAPSLGQAIVLVAPWPWIFGALAVFSTFILFWAALRLPETLHPDNRVPLSPAGVIGAFRLALTTRVAVGYMLASTAIVGCLFAFIASAQQVFADALGRPDLLAPLFALVACAMGVSSFLNARIVERIGARRVSHAALLGFIAVAVIHAAVAASGAETVLTFVVLQSAMMFCFGLVGSNFGAMAMEPLGHIAGTASSVQGFVSTIGAAMIGAAIGQQFDGTLVPLTLGFVAFGTLALLIVLWTERGRLFRPVQGSPQT
jgi:DHA1 family bicyclomycin/chloramphenicol resistance-like MFS transporter